MTAEPAPAAPTAAGPPGTTGRVWTVALPPGLPLLNANQRPHWAKKNRLTQGIRKAAWAVVLQARIPPLQRAHIFAEYRAPDRRKRDVHNLAPSAKAAVDGIVDAGVLPDDNDKHLIGPDMRPCEEKAVGGQLVLHIYEVAGP